MPIIIGGGTGGNAISINSAVGSNNQVILSNGSVALWGNLPSPISTQTFTGSGTWNKPSTGTLVYVELYGGGGGGARDTAAGGGGGGAFRWAFIPMSDLGATVSVTIGGGGTGRTGTNGNGANGGLSSFGIITSGGGGGGQRFGGGGLAAGGRGGGWRTSGNLDVGGEGYEIGQALFQPATEFGEPNSVPLQTLWVGSGGGFGGFAGGASIYGGGGGGGRNSSTVRAGGVSNFGGNGGAGGGTSGLNGGNGVIPGGGGGACSSATGGSGARGECVVYVW